MAVEIEELYTNLNKLLDDICEFLSDESNYEKLSPIARRQADELIKRSKTQLQEIEKIQTNNHEPDEAYVDMERKPVIDDDDKNDIYSSVEENTQNMQNTQITPRIDTYGDLPFKDLSQDIKFGQLSWKTRIILNFEKTRRVYAGIHDNWLLIYSNEKDQKPIQTFDLKFHRAKTVAYKQGKTSSQDFELTSTIEMKKIYYFVALTPKDMLQWVTNINRCHDVSNQTRKSLSNHSDISETYDIIINAKQMKNYIDNNDNNNDDDDDIYHDIEPLSNIKNKNDNITRNNNGKEDKPPDLPIRGKLRKIDAPLPPIPPVKKTESVQSLESYDPIISRKSTESSGNDDDDDDDENSFSDSESDDTYEVFVTTATIEQKPKVINDKNNFVLVKEKPAIKEKPKHLINLRKL